jgi:hypothetical protein
MITMSTMIAAPADERTSQLTSRSTGRGTRRVRTAAEEENVLGARFFLSKPGANGSSPELGRELPNEGEAKVEALKLGVTYYSVQEWRPVPDFGGKNPELKREAITRKGTA